MRVLSTTEVKLTWGDLQSRVNHPEPRMQDRTSGYHVGKILKYIAVSSGQLTLQEIQDEEEMPLKKMLGMAFERWVAGLYPDMIWQPGEYEDSGIIGSPDGLSIAVLSGAVEEFKFTYYSLRREVESQWLWLRQIMAYCKLMGLIHARLHVLYACGNYKERREPVYMRYELEFTHKELDNWWKVMVANRDKSEKE